MNLEHEMLSTLVSIVTSHDELFPLGIAIISATLGLTLLWFSTQRLTKDVDDVFDTKFVPDISASCMAQARLKEAGKLKYCGLRDDPLLSTDPPVYSLQPLDILLPDLTVEQEDKVRDLGHRVSDITQSQAHRTDPSTCYRFLKGKKWSMKQAEKALREAAKWRKKYNVNKVCTDWNLDVYERCLAPWWLSGGFCGHGRAGNPVAVERIGRCKWPKLIKKIPMDMILKLDIVHCVRCLAAFEEDALKRNTSMKPCILVMDLDGFGWDDVQFRAAYLLSKLTNNRSLLMVELLGSILIVNAPVAFVNAWGMFKHLLDLNTQGKVNIVGPSKSLELLQKHIDIDNIPAFLGGNKTVAGDPECSILLAPGGLPPDDALARASAMHARELERLELADFNFERRISGLDDLQDLPAPRTERRSCCGLMF